MLRYDTSVYCTVEPSNVTIVLTPSSAYEEAAAAAESHETEVEREAVAAAACSLEPFHLSGVVAMAPGAGFTAPVREGVVFVTQEPPDLRKLKRYDDYSLGEYRSWARNNMSAWSDESGPVAYFGIPAGREGQRKIVSEAITPPRSGR